MRKYLFILASVFIFFSCQKETIIFDGNPNENYEIPLILSFDGRNCMYDAQRRELKYTLNEAQLNNFSPYVEFQDHSDIEINGKELENEEINNLGKIELNTPYTVEIETHDEINTFQLVFTTIPLVQIISIDEIENEPKALARLIVQDPAIGKSQMYWMGVELRGASNLHRPKKSYGMELYVDKGINLPHAASFFEMQENTKWILDAMYIDKARLRNKASFQLWNSMSDGPEHIGIQSRFVEVYVNHKSMGLYCFNESYTPEFLKLTNGDVRYSGMDNSDFTHFDDFPDYDPATYRWGDWQQRYPDPSESIEWFDFEVLCDIIVNQNDVEFKNKIGSHVDLDNVIDYFLFINLCSGMDDVGKNWNFLKRSSTGKFIIVPWDMDATWGRNPLAKESTFGTIISNGFFDRLMKVNPDNYNERMKIRWSQLRSNEFSETRLNALFSNNFEQLRTYNIIQRENQIWGAGLNIDAEEAYILNWISNRLAFLDGYFDQ